MIWGFKHLRLLKLVTYLKVQACNLKRKLINDCLNALELSWKFLISTIYNFVVIYPLNLLLSKKVAYCWQFLLSFLVINKTLRFNNLKTRTVMNEKISVFVICVQVIIYLLLYNFCNCTFKSYQNVRRVYSMCHEII